MGPSGPFLAPLALHGGNDPVLSSYGTVPQWMTTNVSSVEVGHSRKMSATPAVRTKAT